MSVSRLWQLQIIEAGSVCIAGLSCWSLVYAECERRRKCKLKRIRISWNPRAHTGTPKDRWELSLALIMQASWWRTWCPFHIANAYLAQVSGTPTKGLRGNWSFSDLLHQGGDRARKHPDRLLSLFHDLPKCLCPLQLKLFQKRNSEKQLSSAW